MNRALKRFSLAAAASAAIFAPTTLAFAQDDDDDGPATASAGMTLPQAKAAAGDSDHSQMIGRVGVGFLGRRSVPLGAAATAAGGLGTGTAPQLSQYASLGAPVVGLRYWLDDLLAIEAGLGLAINGGSGKTAAGSAETEINLAGDTVFIIHGGVPLALANAGHFSFQVIPELNVGFASTTIKAPPPAPGGPAGPDTDLSGFHLDVGARAGAEIHFGFIGVPELSVQGSIGLRFDMDTASTTVKSTPESKTDATFTRIGTTVGSNPWAIFTNSVAAVYYF